MFDSLPQNQEQSNPSAKPQIDTVVPPQQSASPQAPTLQQAQQMTANAPSQSMPTSNEGATSTLGQAMGAGQVYTMPEKYMPSASSAKSGSGGGNKRFFLIIAILFAVFVIVLAGAVFFLQPYLQQNQTPAFELPTNGTTAAINTNDAGNENTNTNEEDETNENTNTGLSLNFNVNEEDQENIDNSLFNDNSNTNTNQTTGDTSSVFLDRSDVSSARDKDKDKLTDEEEELYGTEFNRPDSDGDGYVDGTELVNLYAPDEADAALLESDTVSQYSNQEYGWSIYYPEAWFADQVDTTAKQVLFTSDSVDGELVDVSVIENTKNETAAAWFASLYDDIDEDDLESVQIGGATGIVSPDGFTYYVAKGNYIYGVHYNFGTKEKITFETTFQMMVNSFAITEVKKQEASNTNTDDSINTNTNAATNNNDNTNTGSSVNTNSSTNTNTETNANTNAA